jgi:predicted DNA-binding transcriptional regulator
MRTGLITIASNKSKVIIYNYLIKKKETCNKEALVYKGAIK